MQQLTYEQVSDAGSDSSGMPGEWVVKTSNGEGFRWQGFYTGPLELTPKQSADMARDLLGMEPDAIGAAAAEELEPYVSDGTAVQAVILHSATPILRSLQADLADARSGQPADDVATYVEARSVSLASPGDVVVGRSRPWRTAATLAGVEAVEVPGIEYYYLSQSLLLLAHRTDGRAPAWQRLIEVVRHNPRILVRLYALDRDTQTLLLYLKRKAGVEKLLVDANSPEVADYWNTKAPLHPSVDDALTVSATFPDPADLLAAETALSPMAVRLGVRFPVVPGYSVYPDDSDATVVVQRFSEAAALLRERYGFTQGCLKPSEGGAGARISPAISIDSPEEVARVAEQLRHTKEPWVLEAFMHYTQVPIGSRTVPLAPSAHVRNGHVAEGVTLQLTGGTSWQGNVLMDAESWAEAGLSADTYPAMLGMVEELRSAFAERGLRMVTAGIDFAIGHLGGAFGDREILAFQDPNLSSHGAEYLRLFLDAARERGHGRYAATKVVRPEPSSDLALLRDLPEPAMAPGCHAEVISAVPGRWGMLAASAPSPVMALETVLSYEATLSATGRIRAAAARH
ncbi:hypothetical protein ACIGJO_26805 [Streptomyces sp. NPDC079020]|uniref:hypothetical protein n=1 Tax=Streptomyces sp. NPDC079020 TaxID=3365722 RepID=UPI0037D2AEB8